MSFIYLASPYTHPKPSVMGDRAWLAGRAARNIGAAGIPVYSPIVHWHDIGSTFPRDWEFWAELDLPLLRASRLVVVLMLQGWEESRGVQAEIAEARTHGIPVQTLTWGELGRLAAVDLRALLGCEP